MANSFVDKLLSGFGRANSPFGFAPQFVAPSQEVNPARKAGASMLTNIGLGMMANADRGPLEALGRGWLGAQEMQNRNTLGAQEQAVMMEQANAKRMEQEQAAQEKAKRDEFIKTLPPDQQMKALSIPGYLEKLIEATDPNLQQAPEPTANMRDWMMAQENPGYAEFLQGGGQPNEFGLQLVPLVDKDGKPAGMGQAAKTGGIFKDGKNISELGLTAVDPYSLNLAKSSGNAQGAQMGNASAALPAAILDARSTTTKIENLLNNPNLDKAVGYGSWVSDWAVSNEVIDVRGRIKELLGTAFLSAFATLKGGGQITQVEGEKAQAAIQRMETAMRASDPKVFKEALIDFKNAVDLGVKKLEATARGPSGQGSEADPLGLR